MAAIIVACCLVYLIVSFVIAYYVIFKIGFTPREIYENTFMNMPSCVILFIILHAIFIFWYLVGDIYLLTHVGRNKNLDDI